MTDKKRSGWRRGCGCVVVVFIVLFLLIAIAISGVWFWVRAQFVSFTLPLEDAQAACGNPQPRSGPFQGMRKLQEYASTIEGIAGHPEQPVKLALSADDVRDVVEASFRVLAERIVAYTPAMRDTGGAAEDPEQSASLANLFAFDKAGVQAALRNDGVDLCAVLPLASSISATLAGGPDRALSLKTNIFISVGDGALELTFREATLNGEVVDPETLKAFDRSFGTALFQGKSGVSEPILRFVDSLSVVDDRVTIISPTKNSSKSSK